MAEAAAEKLPKRPDPVSESSAEPVSASMLEFLTWVSTRPRSYDDAMEAWRSTCPRHTIWEDALTEQLVRVGSETSPSEVTLTARGRAILNRHMPGRGA